MGVTSFQSVTILIVACMAIFQVLGSAVAGVVEPRPSVFELARRHLALAADGEVAAAVSGSALHGSGSGSGQAEGMRRLLALKSPSVFTKGKKSATKKFTKRAGKKTYAKGLRFRGLQAGVSRALADGGNYFREESVDSPADVDWRETAAITHVLAQGECESCWALAAADAIAMAWAIQNGLHNLPHDIPVAPFEMFATEMSGQQIGDCTQGNVCEGGFPEWALAYAAINGGLRDHGSYPYTAVPQGCNKSLTVGVDAKVTGWEQVPPGNVAALKKAVATQPVIAYVSADNDFSDYESGVYNGNCTGAVDHVVLIVGYGSDAESGQEYWILKNSWGKSWGEGGYMRLAISDVPGGLCGISSLPALYPVNHPANVDSCDQLFPPICGSGECVMTETAEGEYVPSCNCPPGFVSRGSEGRAPTCVPEFPCSAKGREACNPGLCMDLKEGNYSCLCPTGYKLGSTTDGFPACSSAGPTYTTVPGDTCKSVASKVNITVDQLTAQNSALKCDFLIRSGTILAVGNATLTPRDSSRVGCTQWYSVQHGDTCPTIWLGSRLSQAQFFSLNPGLQCKAPHLQVGQKVCINSTAVQAQVSDGTSAVTELPVYVKKGDTLAVIAEIYGTRCANLSAASICKANNLDDCSALEPGQMLFVPCANAVRASASCGCDLKVIGRQFCAANGETYNSWCRLRCDTVTYGARLGQCSPCTRPCAKRAGLEPDRAKAAQYNCFMDKCPYPRFTGTCFQAYEICLNLCEDVAASHQRDLYPGGTIFTWIYTNAICQSECWYARRAIMGCRTMNPKNPWDP